MNVFSGKERTYQSWYGIPQNVLETDRTFNPAGTEKPGEPYNNQTDNYQQDHYQLILNQYLHANWNMNIATFLTYGKGYYEEYKADRSYESYGLSDRIIGGDTISETDLVRQLWLKNYFYGQTFAVQYKKQNDDITFGGSWTKYDGEHFGKVIWAAAGAPVDMNITGFQLLKRI